MKKLILISLCICLAALAACTSSPVPEAMGPDGNNAGEGGELFATTPPEIPDDDTPVSNDDSPVYGGADVPGGDQGGSEPFEGTGELAFSAQYVRTNGYHDGVEYPIVTVITDRAGLDAYFEANEALYDLSHKDRVYSDTTIGFADAIEGYDGEWFASHQLVIVLLEEGSGSVRHEVESVISGVKPEITVRRIVPETGTCDMAEWHLLIELAAGVFEPDARIAVTFVE